MSFEIVFRMCLLFLFKTTKQGRGNLNAYKYPLNGIKTNH